MGKETDFGTEATVATTTWEDTEYKSIHNIEMELVEDTDLTENVWGADSFGVFESNDFGLCAPANLVEGAFNAFDDLIENEASENVTVVHQHSNQAFLHLFLCQRLRLSFCPRMRSIARCECRTTRPASAAEPTGSGNTWRWRRRWCLCRRGMWSCGRRWRPWRPRSRCSRGGFSQTFLFLPRF